MVINKFIKTLMRLLQVKFAKAVVWKCSVKEVFLEISQNLQKNTCAKISFFNKVAGKTAFKNLKWYGLLRQNISLQNFLSMSSLRFIKKETPSKVFPCECWQFSKSTFSYRTTPVAASETMMTLSLDKFTLNLFLSFLYD